MGTRADFYIGRGRSAEWLGSIAWDGYEIDDSILDAKDAATFKKAVVAFLKTRDDATTPEQGWPWPWDNSETTDYAYAFYRGLVSASRFGSAWYNPRLRNNPDKRRKAAVFPDMRNVKQREKFGPHSGVILITAVGE